MKPIRSSKTALAAGVLLALSLGGCVVSPGRVVVAEPPAPIVEVQGVAPQPGYLWINGYWNWVGGRHVWVGGHWAAPPRPGYYWVPHAWERHDGGWRLREGHWDHHR